MLDAQFIRDNLEAVKANCRNRNVKADVDRVVRDVLAGQDVYAVAQAHQISEQAVWDLLGRAARAATGRPAAQVETGGLGSDTDPGVSGGYGETGFGSLGAEPPFPTPEEPREQRGEA